MPWELMMRWPRDSRRATREPGTVNASEELIKIGANDIKVFHRCAWREGYLLVERDGWYKNCRGLALVWLTPRDGKVIELLRQVEADNSLLNTSDVVDRLLIATAEAEGWVMMASKPFYDEVPTGIIPSERTVAEIATPSGQLFRFWKSQWCSHPNWATTVTHYLATRSDGWQKWEQH